MVRSPLLEGRLLSKGYSESVVSTALAKQWPW